MLHDAIVNGLSRQLRPRPRERLGILGSTQGRLDPQEPRLEIRHLTGDLFPEAIDAPHEHARVPQVLAVGHVHLRELGRRLLLERLHAVGLDSIEGTAPFPSLDVAIPRGRIRRCDPERDQVTFQGQRVGRDKRRPEPLRLRNGVIRGHAGHGSTRQSPFDDEGGQPRHSRRPARFWFDYEAVRRQLRNLTAQQFHLIRSRDDQDSLGRQEGPETVHRQLEEAAIAQQAKRLLRPLPSGGGPQSRAPTSCHDNCKQLPSHQSTL